MPTSHRQGMAGPSGSSRPRTTNYHGTTHKPNGKRRRADTDDEDGRSLSREPRETESPPEDGLDDPLGAASHALMNEINQLDPDRKLVLPITSGLITDETTQIEANFIGMLEKYELALVVIKHRDAQLEAARTQLQQCEQKLAYTRAHFASMQSMYQAFVAMTDMANSKDEEDSDPYQEDFRMLAKLVEVQGCLSDKIQREGPPDRDILPPALPMAPKEISDEKVAREAELVNRFLQHAAEKVAHQMMKDAYEYREQADEMNHKATGRLEDVLLRYRQVDERHRQADERHKQADERCKQADERMKHADVRYKQAEDRYRQAESLYRRAEEHHAIVLERNITHDKALDERFNMADELLSKAEQISSETRDRIEKANERVKAAEMEAKQAREELETFEKAIRRLVESSTAVLRGADPAGTSVEEEPVTGC